MSDQPKGDVASLSLKRVVRRIRVASPERVPVNIARCPECDGKLTWQVTSTDGLSDLTLDCENEDDGEGMDTGHRWWQGEWQPVINKVKAWILNAPNSEVSGAGATASNDETKSATR